MMRTGLIVVMSVKRQRLNLDIFPALLQNLLQFLETDARQFLLLLLHILLIRFAELHILVEEDKITLMEYENNAEEQNQ